MIYPTSTLTPILIADGNRWVRAALRSLIAAEPGLLVVAEAGSTEEVEAQDAACAPDVVLLDLGLASEAGSLALLRLLAGGRRRAVVATDMHVRLRAAALAAGACAFLEKGETPETVLATLHLAAEAHRAALRRRSA